MNHALLEILFRWSPVRWMAAAAFLCRGAAWLRMGKLYRALGDFCWVDRVSGAGPFRAAARRVVFGVVNEIRRSGHNHIVDAVPRRSGVGGLRFVLRPRRRWPARPVA